ncbi:hypothetical protein [Roseateles violae]|uniref:Uncharacterized protein n=1 Tax=Roseateles violae TaxID=3058042 RepID=A0ABT8DUX1_9BURK|nr:hypothetical protein [Pelomonas sp. PFR6]MDN3921997.1 hypothetical protein [Pelomonas sp. PFR6]
MWKILVGFAVFAALALFLLSKGGDIDMSGEKHGIDDHAPAASAPAASAAALPASAAASS